jgi:hypothetical protein
MRILRFRRIASRPTSRVRTRVGRETPEAAGSVRPPPQGADARATLRANTACSRIASISDLADLVQRERERLRLFDEAQFLDGPL